MTVICLCSGKLWIHSPLKISDSLIEEVTALGDVKYLVSPNKLHHLFISDWLKRFPEAKSYSSPGLERKRSDIKFSKSLGLNPEEEWSKEINQTIFKGSSVMEEVVFFHHSSKTLILADLIENFKPESLNWWQKIIARFGGVLYPNGKTPFDWRLSFLFGKDKAKSSLATIIEWKPENIIISHGECIIGNGLDFLKKVILMGLDTSDNKAINLTALRYAQQVMATRWL